MSLAGFTFANTLVMVEALAVLLLPAFDVPVVVSGGLSMMRRGDELVLRLYGSSFVSMVESSRWHN